MGSSLGALGIGLSVVFVGFVLVLVGELYYLVCWKKRKNVAHRIMDRSSNQQQEASLLEAHSQEQQRDDPQDQELLNDLDHHPDEELELREVSVIANRHQSFQGELASTKPLPAAGDYLMGPPRFLFTIREETEEIESETVMARSSRNGSLDFALIQGLEQQPPGTPSPMATPFVTPPSSPSLFSTPPATPSPTPSPGIKALAREPPMHCTIFIPSPQQSNKLSRRLHATSPATSASRTTMMMLLLNTSPPGTPPATSPGSAVYRTPPTHLYSPRFF